MLSSDTFNFCYSINAYVVDKVFLTYIGKSEEEIKKLQSNQDYDVHNNFIDSVGLREYRNLTDTQKIIIEKKILWGRDKNAPIIQQREYEDVFISLSNMLIPIIVYKCIMSPLNTYVDSMEEDEEKDSVFLINFNNIDINKIYILERWLRFENRFHEKFFGIICDLDKNEYKQLKILYEYRHKLTRKTRIQYRCDMTVRVDVKRMRMLSRGCKYHNDEYKKLLNGIVIS